MARKQPRLQRVLDAPALASVAYGEIASSIYFALGIVALHALGFTPLVLGLVGLLFLLVSLSYAEGTASIRETGGAATFVRIAFNDLAGFLTGWALFLDYLIVIALSALFMPHYLGTALHVDALSRKPWDVVVAVGAIVVVAVARAFRRPALYTFGIVVPALDLVTQLLLVGVGFAATNGTSALGTTWLHAPLVGIVSAFHGHLPNWFQSMLRVYVGITGALVLLAAATTSMSGFGRLAYSLGEHGQLPAVYGRLNRRTLVAPVAIASAAGVSILVLLVTSLLHDRVSFLASLFSFGVLLAFTSAQLAVIRLRMTRPDLRRPFRVPLAWHGVPVPSALGALSTALVFVVAMVTHRGARYGGPAWLVIGLVVYLLVRRGRGAGVFEHVRSADEQVLPEATYSSILVPMKLGEIGEEMVATAVKLAQERGSAVEALYVIQVPLDRPLDAEMEEAEERAAASIAEAKLLGSDHGVQVNGETVRARSIGQAIVDEARSRDVDLIVLGSAPRWRRQSRFFSPTVDFVLRKAPCEVLIVAFPQGVLEGDGAVT